MTATAGFSNITAIDSRLWIACSKDRRHVAISGVTIDTRGCLVAPLNCLGVKAAIVCGVYVGMKFSAAEIGQTLARCMTSLTIKRWS